MAFQVSPGVNVSEIDLTNVIPAVGTTEAGIAIQSVWGPVQQRVLIENEDQLVKTFGEPDSNTFSSFFTASNFLNYGNKLYVVRAVNETNAKNAWSNTGASTVLIKNREEYDTLTLPKASAGAWVAKYPGDIGNSLRVSVCTSSNAWAQTISTITSATISVTNNSVTVTSGNTAMVNKYIRAGDILILGPGRFKGTVSSISGATITLNNKYIGNTVAGTFGERRWQYYDYFDKTPATTADVGARNATNDEIHIAVIDSLGKITGVANSIIERFPSLSLASDAKTEDGSPNYYKTVINDSSRYIWWNGKFSAAYTNAGTNVTAGKNYRTGADTSIAASVSLTGGTVGGVPAAGNLRTAYDKFKAVDQIDLSLIIAGEASLDTANYVIDIVEQRKDCIALISPRRSDVVNNNSYPGKEVVDTISFRNNLTSTSYAVMDNNFKYQYDKYNDVYRYVPVCGDVAGTIVRTDLVTDPWFSPAGFNRGQIRNVIKLAYNPTQAQRDELYKNGINPVVSFAGQGTVLFGDKTLLGKPSAFDRINVRRLFIVLEKAISTAARFSLFEFNDEFTRNQFRNLVEPFLRDVQGRRGIYDFRVVCDETNNTPEVIDRNEFVGDIYVKPARSINFIQLNFVAVRTGVEFSEIVGQF